MERQPGPRKKLESLLTKTAGNRTTSGSHMARHIPYLRLLESWGAWRAGKAGVRSDSHLLQKACEHVGESPLGRIGKRQREKEK